MSYDSAHRTDRAVPGSQHSRR